MLSRLAILLTTALFLACSPDANVVTDAGFQQSDVGTPDHDAGCGSDCGACCRQDGFCVTCASPDTCGPNGRCVISMLDGCSVTLATAGPAVDTCSGAEICICPGGPDSSCAGTGSCVVASGRSYRFELDYVLTDTTKLNGDAWDAAGGAPDPFAALSVNGGVVGTSVSIGDTFSAQWFPAPAWTVVLNAGDGIRLDAYDEDALDDDWIGACAIESLTAASLRQREFACAAVSADIRGYLQPL